MQPNKINILSTRPLQAALIAEAAEKNILLEIISFVETEPVINQNLKEHMTNLAQQPQIIVFTSMNAVEAVANYLDHIKPDWKIFCIGSATKRFVTEIFGASSIEGTANSASALADEVISHKNVSNVIFFCGDKRRDELPEKLKHHGIEVNEMVVYKTIIAPQQVKRDYHAILFYSPSSVNSFFSVNKINQQTILFAIGNSTADEIKKYSGNKIVIANEPSKDLLAAQAIEFFQTDYIHH
jgi:uroporphyrinogen-III synthase